jgi:hypothetical protein
MRFGDTPCDVAAPEQSTLTLRDPTPEQRKQDAALAETRARTYAQAESRRIAQLESDAASRLPVSLGGSAKPVAKTTASARAAAPDPKQRACASAKSKRDKAYREHGNDMDFDARRRLQDQMSAACGG